MMLISYNDDGQYCQHGVTNCVTHKTTVIKFLFSKHPAKLGITKTENKI